MEHHAACMRMFEEARSGFPVAIHLDSIPWDRLEKAPSDSRSNDNNSQTEQVFAAASLLSEAMIDYDRHMLFGEVGRDKLVDSFLPYFFHFLFDAPKYRDILPQLDTDRWYVGRILPEEDAPAAHDQGFLIDGWLLTGASPVFLRKGKMLIFDQNQVNGDADLQTLADRAGNHQKDLNKLLQSAVVDSVKNEFAYIWRNNSISYIDCYNVGCANADYIRCGKRNILYDIGCEITNPPSFQDVHGRIVPRFPACGAFRRLKPDGVILSHWDLDHFIGCAYAEPELYQTIWIAPSLCNSISALRVARYVQLVGLLRLVPTVNAPRLLAQTRAGHSDVRLYQGAGSDSQVTGAGSKGVSQINCNGLVLEITIPPKNDGEPPTMILLGGDVPYKCMDTQIDLQNPCHFLHVPHHARHMSLDRLQQMADGSGICAIISDYSSHSDPDHYALLKQKFQEVCYTTHPAKHPEPQQCASILSIRINCRQPGFDIRQR